MREELPHLNVGAAGASSAIRDLVPDALKSKRRFVLSFKNRILINTLLVVTGGVIAVAAVLQFVIFPKLKGDESVIFNLKLVHLVVSLAIIGISWIFIELISKRITQPLRQLTKHAEEISREAGKRSNGSAIAAPGLPESLDERGEALNADEIDNLTTSFYRMVYHLKASEARLRESERKYRFLFDNAPCPIFVLDPETTGILDVNARAEKQYQYSHDDFTGMRFTDLGVQRNERETHEIASTLTQHETSFLPVLRHRRRDGSAFLTSVHACFSRFEDRSAVIAAAWDVTEKLEQEAKLVQTSKMATLGEMATGIAHELNQPLNVLKIGSQFLLKGLGTTNGLSEEQIRNTANELNSNVDRASRIISHLREFGRRAEESMSPVCVNAAVRGVLTLVGMQLRERGIEVNLDLADDSDIPEILGDVNRLEQVMMNLVINARDAILTAESEALQRGEIPDKVLNIHSRVRNGSVEVEVSDSGTGVPMDLRAKIFEPFYTTKRVGEGTGLGLSISYVIVKEHAGTIEIDDSQAKGALFRLTFPALNKSRETTHE